MTIFIRVIQKISKIKLFIYRRKYEDKLKRMFPDRKEKNGRVLIDGYFDNPNFWFRARLIMNSLGYSFSNSIGILGITRRRYQKLTFKNFGTKEIDDYHKEEYKVKAEQFVDNLLQAVSSPGCLIESSYPYSFPGDLVYDYVLKKQRSAEVNLLDIRLREFIIDIIQPLFYFNDLLLSTKIDLVIASHAISVPGALVWMALHHKVKVIVTFGNVGVQRFWRLDSQDEIYNCMDRITYDYIQDCGDEEWSSFVARGKEMMRERFSGHGDNIGANYAFAAQKKTNLREVVCKEKKWDSRKKIVVVYASNWFDYPHSCGMKNFVDFKDWITKTYEVARERKDINWLFKPHPCDEWYKGLTLADVIDDDGDHIAFTDDSWNSQDVMEMVDGIVSFHGTVGVEATTLGTPVLNADRNWYEDWNFTKTCYSLEEYISALNSNWWEEIDMDTAIERALVFAYLYWGRVEWQNNYLMMDDSSVERIYSEWSQLYEPDFKKELEIEKDWLKDWVSSEVKHFNAYKMLREFGML